MGTSLIACRMVSDAPHARHRHCSCSGARCLVCAHVVCKVQPEGLMVPSLKCGMPAGRCEDDICWLLAACSGASK